VNIVVARRFRFLKGYALRDSYRLRVVSRLYETAYSGVNRPTYGKMVSLIYYVCQSIFWGRFGKEVRFVKRPLSRTESTGRV